MRHLVPVLLLLAACSSSEAPSEKPAKPGEPDETPPVSEPVVLEAELGLNDVSVLEPLPSKLADAGWLTASSAGARGELLPEDTFADIPTFPVTTADSLAYDRMRVVAIRFDGCHGDDCAAQIRLVMQPANANKKARDSSLHLFYSLDDDEFAEVVHELRALRELAPEQATDAALAVSPALSAQGVAGAYGTALHELVLAHCGEENLSRMTFFLRAPPTQETWFFGGFERKDGKLETLEIVSVGASNQRVIHVESAGGYEFVVTPEATKPENGTALLSSKTAEAATEAARADAFASFLRLENPTRYGVDALPCAGCHLAPFVVAEATRRFGLESSAFPEDGFTSKYLDGARSVRHEGAGANPSSLRAFGYFGADAMIAPRVVNESAAVLADLEARYPAAER